MVKFIKNDLDGIHIVEDDFELPEGWEEVSVVLGDPLPAPVVPQPGATADLHREILANQPVQSEAVDNDHGVAVTPVTERDPEPEGQTIVDPLAPGGDVSQAIPPIIEDTPQETVPDAAPSPEPVSEPVPAPVAETAPEAEPVADPSGEGTP